MNLIFSIFVFIFGAVLGSFLTVFTYRLPKKISFVGGRSFCPRCKKAISWFDNIPIFSFLLLRGKCRNCKTSISFRYPLIEILTGLTFLFLYLGYVNCNLTFTSLFNDGLVCNLSGKIGFITLPYFGIVLTLLIAILVIDLEKQIIPDEIVFFLFSFQILFLLLTNSNLIYINILCGLCAYLFFLFLFAITKGRGMGLGDAKLALVLASILGVVNAVSWLFLSFILGGLISVLLLASKKAKMKTKLAFGPFMVLSFIIEIFFGAFIFKLIL